MTTTQIKTASFDFAEAMKMTKQQAISFSIVAIVDQGFTVQEAFEEVTGQWNLIKGDGTPEEILEAVKSSF